MSDDDVRWIAMAFDKKTERLVKEIELYGLSTKTVLDLYGYDHEDDVMGGSLEIGPAHASVLAPYAHGQLDLDMADWQLEARDA